MKQKEYKIIINGLTESVSEVSALIKNLDNLEKRLDELNKKKIKIPTSEGKGKSPTDALEKEALKNEKLKTDEYKAQLIEIEKLKKENKDLAKIQKQIADGVRDASGEYTNTLGGQRAYLSELKEQLSGMELNTDEWDKLRDKVAEVNQNVLELEKSYGVFNRQVGHYELVNELDEADESAEKLKSTIDDLKSDQSLVVNVKGMDVEFDNVEQAIGEIDDIVQKLSFRLQELKKAGKENTDEFKKLSSEFQELNEQSASLERARKYADELKDTLASSTRGLDMSVQAFQALGNAMQVASGISGLFGQNQEEIEKSINRTVQIMGVLQGVQELYNQALQKGTFLATANAKANALAATIIGKLPIAIKSTTAATKGLSFALKGLGIGLVIGAISLLVEYWDDLTKAIGKIFPNISKLSGAFDKFVQVISGVGNAIFQWLINPLKTVAKTMSNLFQGDFSGAADAAKKGLKDQFKVFENYEKGATAVAKIQSDKRAKIKAEETAKDLKSQIDMLEAKKGADAKYTEEGRKLYEAYYNALAASYDKDSDEYKQAILEKERYNRDTIVNAKKINDERLKKAKEYADKLKEANKQIAENEIAAMKDGFEKKKLELESQKLEEIKIAKEKGIKVQEAIESINKKYNKLEIDLITEHQREKEEIISKYNHEIEERLNQEAMQNFEASSRFFKKNYNDILKALNNFYIKYDELTEKGGKRKGIDSTEIANAIIEWKKLAHEIEDTRQLFGDPQGTVLGNTFDELGKSFTKEFNVIEQQKENNVKKLKALNKGLYGNLLFDDAQVQEELKNFTGYSNFLYDSLSKTFVEIGEMAAKYADDLTLSPTFNILNNNLQKEYALYEIDKKKNEEWYNAKLKELKDYLNENKITQEEYNTEMAKINESAGELYFSITIDHLGKVNDIFKDSLNERNEVTKAYNNAMLKIYNDTFEELEAERDKFNNSTRLDLGSQELNTFADFSQSILSMNKFEGKYKELLTNINKEKEDLQDKFASGIIDEETFVQENERLDNLGKQVQNVFENMKMSASDWAKSSAEIFAAGIGMFSQMFSQIADMQYQNEMKRLEQEQEILDKELEMLEEQLDAQTELYEEHSDNISNIEDELATARGDRREYLLEQINSEMAKREEAWSQEQKIERQKKQNEKKKEQLEKQKEAAEKKRNKRQKAIQILQATASTALAVSNALALQPFPLGLAMSALAAALGAAQISVIAKTKYANGGLLKGKSHAEGGIPGTGAFNNIVAEGDEYIINKHTTRANLPVIEYINSKKRKLNINDFIEFYSSGKNNRIYTPNNNNGKFADGGQLPNINFNPRELTQPVQTDNRPVWVSVQEIERVSEHLRSVRVQAGVED